MSRKNEIVANEVSERKSLWALVRRAEPIQQVRRFMRQKQVLNKDMAERMGVTEAAVSRLLKGGQNIQIDTLYMLADALGEPLEIHFGGDTSEYTFSYENARDEGLYAFIDDENPGATVVQLAHYRRHQAPAYEATSELQCA